MIATVHPRKATPLRVAVVGAGVIGLSVALELRARGADVAVYDRRLEVGAGVSLLAAGLLGSALWLGAVGAHHSLSACDRPAGLRSL